MANANSSGKHSETFEAFSWLDSEAETYPLARFASSTHDLAQGLGLVLELLESSYLSKHEGGTQLFDPRQLGVLSRFAVATANAIESEARESMDWVNKHGGRRRSGGARSDLPAAG